MKLQLINGFVILLWIQSVHMQEPQVNLTTGWIEGSHNNASKYGPTMDFLGIPYAEPPIGNLRFKSPKPSKEWNGILPTKNYSHACAQDRALSDTIWNLTIGFSEDCLTLNVHVPGQSVNAKEKLNVMVFLHGGGYGLGSSSVFPGNDMAAKENVIIVTVNFRLGMFGFLTLGDDRIPGNMALMDQNLALQWVQHNIGKFGGDKDKVTLFGGGSGAKAISLHIVSPKSRGLFHRVILQSGTECSLLKPSMLREDIKLLKKIKQFLNLLGCPDDGTNKTVTCLQNVDADKLLQKRQMKHIPVIDGKDGYIPKEPYQLWKDKEFEPVDFMTGINSDDGDVLLRSRFTNNDGYKLLGTGVSFDEAVKITHLFMSAYMQPPPEIISLVVDDYLTNDKFHNIRSLMNAYRDMNYLSPAKNALDYMQSYSGLKTYLYYFTHKGVNKWREYPLDIGPVHKEETLYQFGYYSHPNVKESDLNVSLSIMHAWATFAKDGKPKYLGADGTEYEWKPYNAEEQYYLEIETDMDSDSMKKRLLPRANSFWNKIIPALLTENSCEEYNPSLISRDTAETILFLLCAVVLCLLLALLIVCANSRASQPKPDKEPLTA